MELKRQIIPVKRGLHFNWSWLPWVKLRRLQREAELHAARVDTLRRLCDDSQQARGRLNYQLELLQRDNRSLRRRLKRMEREAK